MKFVDQTTFGEENGNCFSACIASILELNIEEVPTFVAEKNWYKAFTEWLKPRGYYSMYWNIKDYDESFLDDFGICILGGQSPRGDFLHAVVAEGRKVIHDPHPSRNGIGKLTDVMILVKGIRST